MLNDPIVLMVRSDYLMVVSLMKEELKFVLMRFGEQFVDNTDANVVCSQLGYLPLG